MEQQYYVALSNSQLGPISQKEVEARIAAGEITFAHFVWRTGDSGWMKLGEHESFKKLFAGKSMRAWFVFRNKTQYGPLAQEEVERLIQVGQIRASDLVWSEGMTGWTKFAEIPVFALIANSVVVEAPKPPKFEHKIPVIEAPKAAEHRDAARRPLAAKLIWSNDKTVNVASTRDISLGGMQVEAEQIPGPVGSKIKLNITPADPSGDLKEKIQPFVARGVIVRIREDQRGFSFRFDELPESAKKSIERYVS
jgi:hypothetical protein